MKNVKNRIKLISFGGVIVAVYAALTLVNPLSFGAVQLRFSEILVLLCFYNSFYCVPMIVGCFIANLIGSPFPPDILFGTLGTALAVFPMSRMGRISKTGKAGKLSNILAASLLPVATNAVCVGVLLTFFVPDVGGSLFFNMGAVGAGEFIVVTAVGVPLFKFGLEKNKKFMQVIMLRREIENEH